MTPARDITRLIEIMAALRTPGTGCPWDLAQNFATIAPYTLEEAYEVADAIARDDLADLKEELGDLLLQVVFHARMAEEAGAFDFGDVVEAITEKLVRRHPHVFGDAGKLTPQAVEGLWDRIKAQEKAEQAAARSARSDGALAGVPVALPALTRALKLQDKAWKVGFDWNDPRAVLKKIREEADEIEAALAAASPTRATRRTRSAIFCSRWSISPAMRADPEAIAAAPIRNSSAASPRSSRHWPLTGKNRRTRRSPKWMRCGTRPRRGSDPVLLCAGRAKVLQIDELFRRRQRRLDGAALAHEGDDLGETAEVDLGVSRQHAAIGIEIKRKRRVRYRPSAPVSATMALAASSRCAGS